MSTTPKVTISEADVNRLLTGAVVRVTEKSGKTVFVLVDRVNGEFTVSRFSDSERGPYKSTGTVHSLDPLIAVNEAYLRACLDPDPKPAGSGTERPLARYFNVIIPPHYSGAAVPQQKS